MAITGGFTGKTLRVDLTTRTSPLRDTLTKYGKFWGGTGMAYKVLWDEVPNTVDALRSREPHHLRLGPHRRAPALRAADVPASRRCARARRREHPSSAPWPPATWAVTSPPRPSTPAGTASSSRARRPARSTSRSAMTRSRSSTAPQLWGNGLLPRHHRDHRGHGLDVPGRRDRPRRPEPGRAVGRHDRQLALRGRRHGRGHGLEELRRHRRRRHRHGQDRRRQAAWRTLVENAMAIIGSNNQAFLPNSPQPWAEYTAGQRWYAKKGQFWGAANPPVETGICDPHDRQSVGYRCFKSDPGKYGEIATVRMDGCHACPVRCHQMIYVPTATKWGVSDPYAQNTCTGWWGNGVMDTSQVHGRDGHQRRRRHDEARVLRRRQAHVRRLRSAQQLRPDDRIYELPARRRPAASRASSRSSPATRSTSTARWSTSGPTSTTRRNNADSGMPGLITLRARAATCAASPSGAVSWPTASASSARRSAIRTRSRSRLDERRRRRPIRDGYPRGSRLRRATGASAHAWHHARRARRDARQHLQRQHARAEPQLGPEHDRQHQRPADRDARTASTKSSSSRADTARAWQHAGTTPPR